MRGGRLNPRNLGPQVVLLAGGSALAQVLVALMYAVSARSTTPAKFGEVVVAISVGLVLAGIVDFGSNSFLVRELAVGRLSSHALSSKLAVKLGAMSALALLVMAGGTGIWGQGAIICGAILACQTWSQSQQVALKGSARGDLVAVVTFCERMLGAVLMGALIVAGVSATEGLWLGLALGSVFAGCLARLRTPAPWRMRASGNSWLSPWTGAWHFGIFGLANSLQFLDVAVTRVAGGAASAGTYGAVSRWTQPMGILTNAFSLASVPFIARAATHREAIRRMRRSSWLLGLAVLGCITIFVIAPWLVPLVVGNAYEGSVAVLRVLAVGSLVTVFNQPVAIFLQSRGYDRLAARFFLLAVGLQLGATVVLVPSRGALGAAVAYLVGQVFLALTSGVAAGRAFRSNAVKVPDLSDSGGSREAETRKATGSEE